MLTCMYVFSVIVKIVINYIAFWSSSFSFVEGRTPEIFRRFYTLLKTEKNKHKSELQRKPQREKVTLTKRLLAYYDVTMTLQLKHLIRLLETHQAEIFIWYTNYHDS